MGPGLAWPECWPSDQSAGQVARVQVVELELGQGLLPKAACKTEPGAACHSPLGRAWVPRKTEARAPRVEPRPGCGSQELKVGQEPVLGRGRGGVLGHALQDHSGLALCLWAWAGWAGVKGQWQGRLPQPLGIFPAQLLFCKPN